jgi:hypothetical protein
VVDLGCEVDDGGLEGVVGGEVEVEFEVAALRLLLERGVVYWGSGRTNGVDGLRRAVDRDFPFVE